MNPLNNHPILLAIQDHILRNFPEYMIFVSALAIATVVTMPASRPRSIDDFYAWVRNALQTAVPAARNAHIQVQTPQTSVTATGPDVSASAPSVEVAAADPTQPKEP